MTNQRPTPKRENLLLMIVCNIAAPTLILSKLSTEERLGPVVGLIVALLFPIGYGIWDFAKRRQPNFVSMIGFFSTLLTGGFGLMELDSFWFAVKEASVPLVIGLAVWLSMKSKRPLINQFLYNDQVINVSKIDEALESRNCRQEFDTLMNRVSMLVILSFFISAFLNFILARWLLQSPSGTPEFNAELGKLNLLSWPVIAVPSMGMMMVALWRLLNGVKQLTGLQMEDVLHGAAEAEKAST